MRTTLLVALLLLVGCDATSTASSDCASGMTMNAEPTEEWWLEVRSDVVGGTRVSFVGTIEVDGRSETVGPVGLYSGTLTGRRVSASFQVVEGGPATVSLYNKRTNEYTWGCDAEGAWPGLHLVAREELRVGRPVTVEGRR